MGILYLYINAQAHLVLHNKKFSKELIRLLSLHKSLTWIAWNNLLEINLSELTLPSFNEI
jgi:hypothetical protein